MIRAAMIGFGGIAQSHKNSYLSLEKRGIPVKLVAICDIDPKAFERRMKINIDTGESTLGGDFHTYTDLEEMLANEQIDLIDICLPTPLHSEYAIKMLERGYHVQSEKPMSLTEEECRKMIEARDRSGKQLMIGQCLRFYRQYEFLKACIEDGRYGKPTAAHFDRLSGPPRWGWNNWYMKPELSGGVIYDLHIHDCDMIRWLFGEPKAFSAVAAATFVKHDTVFVQYYYENLPVSAVAEWSLKGTGFRAGYRVGFEKASVIFDENGVTVYSKEDGAAEKIEMAPYGGIEAEIEYFVDCLEKGIAPEKNMPESSARTVAIANKLLYSADHMGERMEFDPPVYGN
ncbi:MAG: Gfo/Idh/MocA family oxidoreductase [Clostridia bacterium]|nr:Gfo/Idh/MocA family oxidoreductase [Clostridia bacterium]